MERAWRAELLGEHVVISNIVRRFGRHLFVVVDRAGNLAEIALGEQGQLIVIVTDHSSVPRDAKVLEQHVPGEDISAREIFDRRAVVQGRLLQHCSGVACRKIQIKRGYPAFSIEMPDDDAVPIHTHGTATRRQEIIEQWSREAGFRPWKFHWTRIPARVRQSPHAIPDKNKPISIHDPPPRGPLWGIQMRP